MKFMENLKKKKANNKGFSLVELIIVIAIMAILVGIVGTQVIPYLNRSREAKDLQILSAYSTAAVSAYSMNAELFGTDKVTISINASSTTSNDESKYAKVADTIEELSGYNQLTAGTGKTAPVWSSTNGKAIALIEIEIDPANHVVTVKAYKEAAKTNQVLETVTSYI